MELEQPILSNSNTIRSHQKINNHSSHSQICTDSSQQLASENDLINEMESFRIRGSDSADEKLCWLRSQIIGANAEFESPLGNRRMITYADHTASGRSLHYIEKFIINNVLPFYGNSHTSDSYVGHRTTKTVHEATQYVKKCLGGGEDDALIFCGSGTTAAIKRLQEVMGIAIPSALRERVLSNYSLMMGGGELERWVVFVGPYEHHSNLLSWRQSLAEVVEIGLDDDGLIDMEALRLQLGLYQSTKRPMLGSFSACSNVTGICTNTRALASLLHQFGAFACFDFAASGPYVEVEMRSREIDGYDAIFLSPHKFLGGPGSPGILLMSKALYQLGSSPPSTCGGGTVNFVNGFNDNDTLYVDDIEERENAGTPPIIQTIRAALAFWVKEYIGYQVIEKQENEYIEKALERLLPNQNIWILGNTSAKRQAVLSFLIHSTTYSSSSSSSSASSSSSSSPSSSAGKDEKIISELYMWRETGNRRDKPLHGPFVAKLLNDLFGIQARGGCACAGPYGHSLLDVDESRSLAFRSAIQMGYSGVKPGWTRVSFPYYMSNEEFEFILAAIEFVAIYGQRFLPFYHFNWKTGAWTFKKRVLKEALQADQQHKFHDFFGKSSTAMAGGESKEQQQGDENELDEKDFVGVIGKYASYLETAKRIASLLPMFPAQRRVPEAIDPNLVPFRV